LAVVQQGSPIPAVLKQALLNTPDDDYPRIEAVTRAMFAICAPESRRQEEAAGNE